MKILLVYTNAFRQIAPAPLGASLVASRLRRDGHQVRLVDLMFSRSPTEEAALAAKELRPDLIGFSLRNVDNQSAASYFNPLPTMRSVVAAAKSAWPAPTLLGGTAFTTFPAQYLQALGADYGIAGDDLEPISGFVSSLGAGRPDLETPGLVYRENGVHCNPCRIRGYAATAFDGWDFLDFRPYRKSFDAFWDAGLTVRTGCPFGCVYCDTYRTFGREWVLRDPRQVAEELVTLGRRHGVRSVFLADAGFNRPLHHAKAVLEEIVRARSGVELNGVFEPGEVDAEFARLFRRAKGSIMMIFAGSLSDPALEASHKPFGVSDVLLGARLLGEAGVSYAVSLGLGGPGETRETVEKSLTRADELKAVYTWVLHGYRIMPDTPLRDIAVAEGVIAPNDDCFQAKFYYSPATPPEWLDERIKAYAKARQWQQLRGLPWIARVMWNKWRR